MSSAPQVGDIVHYQSFGTPKGEYAPACRAAIVTEIVSHDEERTALALAVLNPTGMFFNTVYEDPRDQPEGGTWHYRCRRI